MIDEQIIVLNLKPVAMRKSRAQGHRAQSMQNRRGEFPSSPALGTRELLSYLNVAAIGLRQGQAEPARKQEESKQEVEGF